VTSPLLFDIGLRNKPTGSAGSFKNLKTKAKLGVQMGTQTGTDVEREVTDSDPIKGMYGLVPNEFALCRY
jgi:hypothetical protein